MLPSVYILFTAVIVLVVLMAYRVVLQRMAMPARDRSRKFLNVSFVMLGWITYITVISFTDLLKDLSLPPKFVLLIFLPLIVGMIIFYRNSKKNKVIREIPRTWPVYFQSFRIVVELMLLYTFYADIIPESATFEGLNFDVLMGISAPFIAYFIVRKNGARSFQYFWNILGILMVLFVAFIIASSMYFPRIWGSEVPLVSLKFVEMPFILLAGFLAPIAIFMHVLSLAQLRR